MPALVVTVAVARTLMSVADRMRELCAAFYTATAVNETTIACPAGDICQPLSADQLQAGRILNASCKGKNVDAPLHVKVLTAAALPAARRHTA